MEADLNDHTGKEKGLIGKCARGCGCGEKKGKEGVRIFNFSDTRKLRPAMQFSPFQTRPKCSHP